MLRMLAIFSLLFSAVCVFAQPQDLQCCGMDREPRPQHPNPELIGKWLVSTDWTCAGSEVLQLKSTPDQRLWTLSGDGICSDSKGNLCMWGAEGGRIWIDFVTLGLRFRGKYEQRSFSGHFF